MGKIELDCGGSRITLEDSVALAPRAASEADTHAITLDDGKYVPASVMRVIAARNGSGDAWALTLTSSGGATTVHERSALCLGERVAVAIGPYVVAIEGATGAIAWKRQCDPASCFGIYRAPSGKGLISHGEQQIARLAEDGGVEWTFGGKDIFTGPFAVAPEGILATDFGGDVYALSFDGALQAVDKGKPFPH